MKILDWLFGLRKKYAPTDQELYNEGYLWASKELAVSKPSQMEAAIHYVDAMTYNNNTPFDKGARQALRELTSVDITPISYGERNLS